MGGGGGGLGGGGGEVRKWGPEDIPLKVKVKRDILSAQLPVNILHTF